jgi:two-component system sensor histidine kinase and response regulator WspE
LQLPLTLSVLRALLVEIAGEPYAVPLNQIARILKLPRTSVEVLEGRHTFQFGDQQVRLLSASQVLECEAGKPPGTDLPVVVLSDRGARYGLIVDQFLGERELVVQPLDPRLGKVRDISAAALMENGAPVLIIDVEEVVRSIETLIQQSGTTGLELAKFESPAKRIKRVLAVDDSPAVRELERKLLTSRGFQADVAADGLDAWNAVRAGAYDLVITDVDMPQLNGFELVGLIKKDSLLKSLPVIIISYKDRPEDRMRGLQAGADCYLTKTSFQDERLMQAVIDLIGEPET